MSAVSCAGLGWRLASPVTGNALCQSTGSCCEPLCAVKVICKDAEGQPCGAPNLLLLSWFSGLSRAVLFCKSQPAALGKCSGSVVVRVILSVGLAGSH